MLEIYDWRKYTLKNLIVFSYLMIIVK